MELRHPLHDVTKEVIRQPHEDRQGSSQREGPFNFHLTALSEPVPHFVLCACLPGTAVLCVIDNWNNKLEILHSCTNSASQQRSVCVTSLFSYVLDGRLEAVLVDFKLDASKVKGGGMMCAWAGK